MNQQAANMGAYLSGHQSQYLPSFLEYQERCRLEYVAYVEKIIREADAKRDAMYVDPYSAAIGQFLEYECGCSL